MDEKILEVLNESVRLQREQNELLKKHLLRVKYSLWGVFCLMTLVCVLLGLATYWATKPTLTPATPWLAPSAPQRTFPAPTPTSPTLNLLVEPVHAESR
jgi:hypothetical protein